MFLRGLQIKRMEVVRAMNFMNGGKREIMGKKGRKKGVKVMTMIGTMKIRSWKAKRRTARVSKGRVFMSNLTTIFKRSDHWHTLISQSFITLFLLMSK